MRVDQEELIQVYFMVLVSLVVWKKKKKNLIFLGTTKTFSDKKTKRKWKPNIKAMSLHSEILEKKIRVKVSMKALRNIEHKGKNKKKNLKIKKLKRWY